MVYQEELRAKQTLALWVGELGDEDALLTYLAQPFEEHFGFLLNPDEPPEFTCSFESQAKPPDLKNPNRRRASTVPFDREADVQKLMQAFSSPGSWISDAVRQCHAHGIKTATVAIAFPNLYYRAELCRNGDTPIRFVGNIAWPEGASSWEQSEKLRLVCPPFPKLVRKDWNFEGGDGRFEWEGIARLPSWAGFATPEQLHTDGFVPTRGVRPQGDLLVNVSALTPKSSEPSDEQKRAFEFFLAHEATIRDRILDAIFEAYPEWRENFYGSKVSSDGCKTWQTGWELPEMYPPDLMPAISTRDDLRRLIRPNGIHVMTTPQAGMTRLGFSFGCRWDEEHGLGISTHAGQVIAIGQADESFSDF